MTDHARAIEAGARADLLPCPFCGGSDLVLDENGYKTKWVVCDGCGATIDDSPHGDCVDVWNRRAAIASGALVPASAGQSPAKAFHKIWAGLEEARSIANGEQPAASIYVQGHQYVPASATKPYSSAEFLTSPEALDEYVMVASAVDRLQRDCAEAYQVVGVLAGAHGDLFDDPQVIKALDNLSAASNPSDPRPHDDLLPFTLDTAPASGDNTTLATSATNRIAKVVSMSPETRDDVHGIIQEALAGFVNAAIRQLDTAPANGAMKDGTIDRVAEAIAARAIERGHPIKPVVVHHVAVAAIEAMRGQVAPASGDYVVVPRSDLQVVVDIAGRNESAIEIECIKEWLKDAASSNGGGK